MSIPTLETSRLRLRPFATTDIAPMVEILGGHDVLRYFPRTDAPGAARVAALSVSFYDVIERSEKLLSPPAITLEAAAEDTEEAYAVPKLIVREEYTMEDQTPLSIEVKSGAAEGAYDIKLDPPM